MTMTERKVIKAKVGLLELAKQLGSVTQACRGDGLSYAPGSLVFRQNPNADLPRQCCFGT
jgi:hypothetical protein